MGLQAPQELTALVERTGPRGQAERMEKPEPLEQMAPVEHRVTAHRVLMGLLGVTVPVALTARLEQMAQPGQAERMGRRGPMGLLVLLVRMVHLEIVVLQEQMVRAVLMARVAPMGLQEHPAPMGPPGLVAPTAPQASMGPVVPTELLVLTAQRVHRGSTELRAPTALLE
jgi:hypothetical protein